MFTSLSSALAALSSFSLDLSEGTDCKADMAEIAADMANTAEERAAAKAILAGWNDSDFMSA
jgi:hypothetical protein